MSALAVPEATYKVEEGVWVLIFGELSMFTVLFASFIFYRAASPELYIASQASLHHGLGAFNTLVLLGSSYFVAMAMAALRQQHGYERVRRHLRHAMLCGALFVVVKLIEYASALSQGFNLLTNEFFMFYFTLTGIHLVHVLVGLLLLAALSRQVGSKLSVAGTISEALAGFSTSFWHMVDIVWIVLFPLLYLLR